MPSPNSTGTVMIGYVTSTAVAMVQLSKCVQQWKSGVFNVVSAATVAIHQRGKHISSTIERLLPYVRSVPRAYKKTKKIV
jgi:hypothetical protein